MYFLQIIIHTGEKSTPVLYQIYKLKRDYQALGKDDWFGEEGERGFIYKYNPNF